jgi:hypothetical protein
MKLHEVLKICLLSLATRYPESVVVINEVVVGRQSFWAEAKDPLRLLELLGSHAPHLLQAPACLVIDAGESVIYLVEQSEETPAFWIYCGGCTPSQRQKQMQRA